MTMRSDRNKHIPRHLLKLLPREIGNLLVEGAVLVRGRRVPETVAGFAGDLLLHGVESYGMGGLIRMSYALSSRRIANGSR